MSEENKPEESKPGEIIQPEPPVAPAPVPEPAKAEWVPVAPAPETVPAAPLNPDVLVCGICGKGGWKNQAALSAHERFGHKKFSGQGRPKTVNRVKPQPQEDSNGQPAPDFSDIETGPRIVDTPPPAPSPAIRFEAMAAMSFDMGAGIMARIFGPEWNPTSKEERDAVVGAIKAYYESVDMPDIPPGYMLCFVLAAYSAPRLAQQPTRTKLQAAWLWLKMRFQRKQRQPLPKP